MTRTRAAAAAPAAALLTLLLALSPAPAQAWGFRAHRLVNRLAIGALPAPLRPLFAANADYLAEHAVDPDLWRAAGKPGEGPAHFLDLDAFGAPPFSAIPRDEAAHLARRGAEAAGKGRLPWRVAEVYRDLVQAFRDRDSASALRHAAVLGHYVGDAHVPLHAVLNYDGQLSGQPGLHDRWERHLVERFHRQLEAGLPVAAATRVADPVAFTLDTLRASFAGAEGVLASDKACAGPKDLAQTPEDDRYDDAYYSRLYERERTRLRGRLARSATAIASLWLSAWHEAGRPRLPQFRFAYVRGTARAIMVSLDGASPTQVEDALARGLMPNLARIRSGGASGRVLPALPLKTASTHAALWTGAWGDVNGITGNEVPPAQGPVTSSVNGYASTMLKAEPLWVTAARQGLRATVVGTTQVYPFEPYQEERRFGGHFGRSLTLIDGYRNPRAPEAVYDRNALALQPAAGWPAQRPPRNGDAREFRFTVAGAALDGLLFDDPADPAVGFDSLYLARGKDDPGGITLKPRPALGADASAFAHLVLDVDGGKAGAFFRLFSLAPDASEVLLYSAPVTLLRTNDSRVDAAALEATGGFVGNGAHRYYTAGRLGRPLWAGGDGSAEARYLETAALVVRQVTRLAEFAADRTAWDLLLGYLPFPDEALHVWMGALDPRLPGHDPALAAKLRPPMDAIWRLVDGYLGRLAERAGARTILAVTSDHGLVSVRRMVRPNAALAAAGLFVRDGTGVDAARSRALFFHGSGYVLVNTTARGGIVPPEQEAEVREAVKAALLGITDPASGERVVEAVLDARAGGREPGLGGPTGGDLYVRFAADCAVSGAADEPAVEPLSPRGEHFQRPELPEMQAVLIAAGPGVARGAELGLLRQIDVAPTLAALLGLEPPAQAAGHTVSAALARRED